MTTAFKLIDCCWREITVFLWLVITTTSLMPLPELPELPGSDKIHHLLAYTLLMFPVALHKPRGWLYLAIGFIVWSAVIELIQPYVNRHAEGLDLLANAAGVLLGLLLGGVTRLLCSGEYDYRQQ